MSLGQRGMSREKYDTPSHGRYGEASRRKESIVRPIYLIRGVDPLCFCRHGASASASQRAFLHPELGENPRRQCVSSMYNHLIRRRYDSSRPGLIQFIVLMGSGQMRYQLEQYMRL